MKNKILFTFLLLTSFITYSQVGIGTPTPNSSSQLEVAATNRGVLIPRINLTSSTDASTIAGGNVNSLLIFNTATISDVKPGYYYWFDNKWNRIVVSGETVSTPGTVIYNSVTQTFSYIDNSGNSQVIDFSTIVKANETITNQIQNTATGAITYTNEAGNSTISQVVSANAGNLIKAGTDGGAMLDVAAIPVNPTTVSNASTGNTATVTVNGVTSSGAPIVNLNETSLSGTSLTTTVNGVSSTALDLSPILASGTTNTLGLAGNTLTSTVNGVSSTSNAVSDLSNASTGNTATITVNGIASSGAPIVNLNETSLSGTSLTTTVNGVSSTALDLSPILASGTTNTLGLAGNTLTSTVNGVSSTSNSVSGVSNASTGNTATVTVNGITSSGAPIVNLNETSLSGTSLTTTVNGVASTALDLSPILASGTTNTLGLAGNTLTSTVNGVSSTSNAVSGLSNASTGNTATITVNGITSTGAPIVNLNETSLSGTSLTTTVNGVASTALDLAPAILASQTVTNLVQTASTGVITYSNESGTDQTANVTSTNAGNILTVGTDGGSLLTPTSLSNATSVSNSSTGNTATVTVNGKTSSGAPIVNLNETSLSGTSLTTTVNGVSSTALDLAPAILASQTVTNLVQTASTGVITYTNESGTDQTANVTSTNAGNILTVGTDGGSLLTPTSLSNATSVSNSSTGNTATVTVNGKTSTGAPIVNLNETSLLGTSLTTTVNGVASTALDLAPAILASQTVTNLVQTASTGVITYTNESGTDQTANVTSTNAGNILTVGTDGGSLLTPTSLSNATSVSNSSTGNTATVTVNGKTSTGASIVNSNTLTAANGNLVSTVNGVATTPAVSVLIAANNGLTATNGNVQLDGSLIKPTTIATDAINTLSISGLQSSVLGTDLVVVADNTGTLKTKTLAALNATNWNLIGNAATDPLTNFVGTTDDVDLIFKRNSIQAGKIEATNTSFGVDSFNDYSPGLNNVAIGTAALFENSTGNNNTAVGYNALTGSRTGNNNASLGSSAGSLNTQGSQNTFIGTNSNPTGGVFINNATAIGYNSTVATSNSLVLGAIGADAVKVGIGTDSPENTLHVKPRVTLDPVRFEGLQPSVSGTDLIVVADNTGVLRTVTPASLIPATSVSNTSASNLIHTTVNGVTGSDVNIINTNTLIATNGNLVSTVNGIATTPVVPVLIAANNGLTVSNGNVQLSGSLIKPTTIATDAVNTLAISGLQTVVAPTTDNLLTADASGVLHQRTVADAVGTIGWLISGNTGTNPANNFLGTTDDKSLVFRVNNVKAGIVSPPSAFNNTALGYQALQSIVTTAIQNTSSIDNTAIGSGALSFFNLAGNGNNTAVGVNALMRSLSGVANTAVGSLALANYMGTSGNTASRNTAVGYLAMTGANTNIANNNGAYNTAIGISAMNNSTTNISGNYNVAVGANALNVSASGSYNTALGPNAGNTLNGNNNIMIGGSAISNMNPSGTGVSNEMNIGNTLFGTSVNGLAAGTAGRIGININVPSVTLDVNGQARVRTLPAGASTDNIVTVDASGNLRTVSQTSSIATTMNIVRNTADYTIDPATDNVILIDAASNDVTVTVPSGVAVGRVFIIKRVDSFAANTVTITFAGASAAINETDTSISVDIKTAYQIITAGSDKWQTISKF